VAILGHRQDGRLDGALIMGRSAGEAGILMQMNWRTPIKIRRIELTGSAGYAEADLISPRVRLYPDSPESPAPGCDQPPRSLAAPPVELPIERREPLAEEISAFWRAIHAREPGLILAREAVAAVRLTEAARSRLGR